MPARRRRASSGGRSRRGPGILAVHVFGHEQLGDLARRLRKAGRADLRKELTKGIRRPAAEVAREAKRNVLALPARGRSTGLRRRVARTVRTTVRTSGSGVGVRVWSDPKKMPGGQGNLPAHMNTGRWRHPVWGDRESWVTQTIEPRWFDRAAEAKAPQARKEILQVLKDIRRRLERG